MNTLQASHIRGQTDKSPKPDASQSNENGLGLSEEDSIDFLQFLSNQARNHTLAIGLKNAGSIIPDVLDIMSFSVNEQVSNSRIVARYPFVTV